ncbi:wd40 repeat-containing protein [Lasius niger]|uniref:Wd40 repeat-containing protein n=1 Tax=Lasius niger TaxID=67767 RepID=A0A0J7KG40_LASNI|nr:wd40 repeat-containing protein [Lasius niger]
MSTLRDRIKRHLELSERLHKAALEVLKAKIVDEKLKNKKILEVASKYGFTNTKLKQKVKILREKKDYLVSKKKIESIVEKMQDVQCTDSVKDICEKHNLKSTLISTELRKYRRLHGRYQYDKPIRCHGYFTYLNEFSMLEHLKTWKQTDRISSCHCKTCALEYLPKWAYIFAKDQKIDYRNSWDTKKEANVEWVLEFEMRHYNEIIKSEFKSPNLCKYDHPQLYTSGRQTPCDISLPASTSQALQTKNSQSDQENFNVSIILY